jgi:hypothetical protein
VVVLLCRPNMEIAGGDKWRQWDFFRIGGSGGKGFLLKLLFSQLEEGRMGGGGKLVLVFMPFQE